MRENGAVNRQSDSPGNKRLHFPVNQAKPLFVGLRSVAVVEIRPRPSEENTSEYRLNTTTRERLGLLG